MKYNLTKTIPHSIKGKEIPATPDFDLRWEMCNKMKLVDPDVNFYSLRPLSNEFVNFIDGKRTVEDIATAVGYEYGIKIKGEHVMLFFEQLKDKGYLTFSDK